MQSNPSSRGHVNEIESLPPHLAERCRIVKGTGLSREECAGPTDGPVVWWVHHAMRVEENPALDVAREIAAGRDRPLRAVAVVGGRHPYNNDRHLTFALEGLRDLQGSLRRAGLDLEVVIRDPKSPSVMTTVTREASAVVTEEMPMPPWPSWLRTIASATSAPLIAVDASCVVPMSLSRKAPDRAFVFRDRFADERRGRMVASWPESTRTVSVAAPGASSVDVAEASDEELAAIVGGLDVDHGVGPVPDTRGGTEAGLERWRTFRSGPIRRYAKDRNNAALDAVSRISAYLHYGMVSPFRIAREACHANAEKFLEELLVWRELAWHWASRTPNAESFESIPAWARKTLDARRGDARDRVDDESLGRGVTGEPLWDLAQRSLLRQGELHNNVRMTWGKRIPEWSATPEEAVRRLFELNHRFALDGSDPSSAGGLLWCLGLFDRPFTPERPVLGAVRGRSVADHEERIDMAAYAARVSRPQRRGVSGEPLRVAVLGAGVCGLAAARTLSDHGIEVGVFDKGRGPGGRISTRRGTTSRFDHGAGSFTASDPRFGRVVQAWRDRGIVAAWEAEAIRLGADGEIVEVRSLADAGEVVGVGGMNRIAKHLGQDLGVSCGSKVERLVRDGAGRWTVEIDGREASTGWDAVISTLPPVQTEALLVASSVPTAANGDADSAAVEMQPSWVAMIEIAQPLDRRFGRLEASADAAWRTIVDQGSKPGRVEAPGTAFVLEAATLWSLEHLEVDRDAASGMLGDIFLGAIARSLGDDVRIVSCEAHRWRYARPDRMTAEPVASRSVADTVVIGGDRQRGGTVEAAWLAGLDLAGVVLRDPNWAAAGLASPGSDRQDGASLF